MAQRVYLPLTPSLLRRAREQGGFGTPPLPGHAVTPALVDELGDAGSHEEECEYAAMNAAGLESLTMLAPDDPPRRVVVAVDVPAWEPRTGDDVSAVTVPTAVPWRRVAAVHVDGPPAEPDVLAARDGTADALERCLDHDLGWYAVQEVDELLRGLAWG